MANSEEYAFFDNLLSFLLLGKDVLIELKRNLFTAQNEYAIVLRERCNALVDGLMVVSSHTLTSCEISDGICSLVVELQRLSNILEERLENFPDEEYRFVSCSEKGGGRGRSKFLIPESQIVGLRSLNFSWKDIAAMLGVSARTLSRRRAESDLPVCLSSHSNITDEELDRMVGGILRNSPNSGERMVTGALLSQNVRIQRARIRASINRIDPVSRQLRRHTSIQRRVYSVPTPNALW